jgi:hypothetical protein
MVLPPSRPRFIRIADAGDADDDRRDDQRHDQHLQGVQEQLADEIEHGDEVHAEQEAVLAHQQTDDDRRAPARSGSASAASATK